MTSPEPWLRGADADVPALGRSVLHALQLAEEDLKTWCGGLSDADLNLRPLGLQPVAFHVRHMARSLDRLLTYAEGRSLSAEQLNRLQAELEPDVTRDKLLDELSAAVSEGARRIRILATMNLEEPRSVGKKKLPSTLGGLLVHIADHTQRHVGQAITTAKIVSRMRETAGEGNAPLE